MGKNQQHKAMQQARHSSGGDSAPGGDASDGKVDASFHTPEWHAARIAQLTSQRMSWEEWKIKKKEDDKRRAAEEDQEEARMREYRKQLDADRDAKLARGWNHKELRDKIKDSKKRKRKDGSKDKDKKKHKSKKDSKDKKGSKDKKKRHKKHRRHSDSDDSDSDSDSGASSSDGKDGKAEDDDNEGNPYRLSAFFEKK